MPMSQLTQEQLAEAMRLMRKADSVELKLTVPNSERRATMAALGIDPLDAEIRQVAFLDTPDLTLFDNGLVLRARRVQRKPGDTVVKLRPIEPDLLDERWRRSKSFSTELDVTPTGFVCSGSMKGETADDTVKQLYAGKRKPSEVFSDEQRDLYKAFAPKGIKFDNLKILGPITTFKLKFQPEGFPQRVVAELWMYPDLSQVVELSIKTAPHQAFQVAAEARRMLTQRNIHPQGEQSMKTKAAMQFFAGLVAASDL